MKNALNATKLTGLQRLTQEQLINIILRKDDIEQKLREEVKKQKKANKQLTEQIRRNG